MREELESATEPVLVATSPSSSDGCRTVPRLTSRAVTLPYVLLDVFTDQPFTGNPLAVFVDPGPLSDGQMQRIAAELHLSETAFVWSPARPRQGWRTRIFTPRIELPFPGHPTIGTAFLLAALGHVDPQDNPTVTLEQAIGTVHVAVSHDGRGVPVVAEFLVPQPSVAVNTASPAQVAAAAGLEPADVHHALPVRAYSAGVPFSIVPVADPVSLARARLDATRWAADVAGSDAPHLYLVTPLDDLGTSSNRWRTRMFAPAMGISEDPATGAAAAAFAGYLDDLDGQGAIRTVDIEQGMEIGRPSRLRVRISRGGTAAAPSVRVGGAAVIVGRGTLATPGPATPRGEAAS
jgi:trans-2,3-dihydro-3-hydroxyanthranilate isomerase